MKMMPPIPAVVLIAIMTFMFVRARWRNATLLKENATLLKTLDAESKNLHPGNCAICGKPIKRDQPFAATRSRYSDMMAEALSTVGIPDWSWSAALATAHEEWGRNRVILRIEHTRASDCDALRKQEEKTAAAEHEMGHEQRHRKAEYQHSRSNYVKCPDCQLIWTREEAKADIEKCIATRFTYQCPHCKYRWGLPQNKRK